MSTMEVTSCDGCDEMAPRGYSSILPDDGWMHVKGRADFSFEDYDVCSWQCLATLVAAKISEQATA